jgi:hypothetical protein
MALNLCRPPLQTNNLFTRRPAASHGRNIAWLRPPVSNNPPIFQLWLRPPGGIMIADCNFARRDQSVGAFPISIFSFSL